MVRWPLHSKPKQNDFESWIMHFMLKTHYNAHINGLPGGNTPGTTGGNEGEFGILSVYSACEPRGNYKLRNNRTMGGGEVGL